MKKYIKNILFSLIFVISFIFSFASSNDDGFKSKFQYICVENIITCVKVNFVGNYSYEERYMYLYHIVDLLKYLDNNLMFDNKISKTFKSITLNKSGGLRRGYATKDTIEINLDLIYSYVEFVEILTHELAHVIDLGVVVGKSSKYDNSYTEFGKVVFAIDDPSIDYYKISWDSETIRKSSSIREDFCSGYGLTNPFEDFAECLNLYIHHNALLRFFAKNNIKIAQKYKFISDYLGGNYINNSIVDLQFVMNNFSWRPWDTTKIGY